MSKILNRLGFGVLTNVWQMNESQLTNWNNLCKHVKLSRFKKKIDEQ